MTDNTIWHDFEEINAINRDITIRENGWAYTNELEKVCQEADEVNSVKFSKELIALGDEYYVQDSISRREKSTMKDILDVAKDKGITKNMIVSYCLAKSMSGFNRQVLLNAAFGENVFFEEEEE